MARSTPTDKPLVGACIFPTSQEILRFIESGIGNFVYVWGHPESEFLFTDLDDRVIELIRRHGITCQLGEALRRQDLTPHARFGSGIAGRPETWATTCTADARWVRSAGCATGARSIWRPIGV